jgi:hypothetical protein
VILSLESLQTTYFCQIAPCLRLLGKMSGLSAANLSTARRVKLQILVVQLSIITHKINVEGKV